MATEVKPPIQPADEQRTNQTTSHTADEKPHISDNQEINTGNVAQKSGSEAGSPAEANSEAEKQNQIEGTSGVKEMKGGANAAGEDDVKPGQLAGEPEEVKRSLPARLRRRLARRTNNPNMSERHAKDPAPAPPGPVPAPAIPAEPAVAAKPVSKKNCGHCSGTGLNPDDYGKLCAWCDGKGIVKAKRKQ